LALYPAFDGLALWRRGAVGYASEWASDYTVKSANNSDRDKRPG
jgi:hypothetical protein